MKSHKDKEISHRNDKRHSCTKETGGFPGGSAVKNPPANAGDLGSIPGLDISPGKANGNPIQYSCLGIP